MPILLTCTSGVTREETVVQYMVVSLQRREVEGQPSIIRCYYNRFHVATTTPITTTKVHERERASWRRKGARDGPRPLSLLLWRHRRRGPGHGQRIVGAVAHGAPRAAAASRCLVLIASIFVCVCTRARALCRLSPRSRSALCSSAHSLVRGPWRGWQLLR